MRKKLLVSATCFSLMGGSALLACEGNKLLPVPQSEQPAYQTEAPPEIYTDVPQQSPVSYTFAGAGGILLAGWVICAAIRKV